MSARTVAEVKLKADAVEWREVEGEIVALDLDSSEYLAVNQTGTVIWPLLVDGATREELAAQLAGRYEIDQDTAERDVDQFVSTLSERGLIDAG
jgi:hypothetical protein